jgi:hypothetical protein
MSDASRGLIQVWDTQSLLTIPILETPPLAMGYDEDEYLLVGVVQFANWKQIDLNGDMVRFIDREILID